MLQRGRPGAAAASTDLIVARVYDTGLQRGRLGPAAANGHENIYLITRDRLQRGRLAAAAARDPTVILTWNGAMLQRGRPEAAAARGHGPCVLPYPAVAATWAAGSGRSERHRVRESVRHHGAATWAAGIGRCEATGMTTAWTWLIVLQRGRPKAAAERLADFTITPKGVLLQRGRPGPAAARDPTVIFTSNGAMLQRGRPRAAVSRGWEQNLRSRRRLAATWAAGAAAARTGGVYKLAGAGMLQRGRPGAGRCEKDVGAALAIFGDKLQLGRPGAAAARGSVTGGCRSGNSGCNVGSRERPLRGSPGTTPVVGRTI